MLGPYNCFFLPSVFTKDQLEVEPFYLQILSYLYFLMLITSRYGFWFSTLSLGLFFLAQLCL